MIQWSSALNNLLPRTLGQDRNASFLAFNSPARLYLAHHEVTLSEPFLKTRRVAVLLDKAHKMKNPNAEVSQCCMP